MEKNNTANGLGLYNHLINRVTELNERAILKKYKNNSDLFIREELINILITYFNETREHLLNLKKVYSVSKEHSNAS